VTSFPTCPHLSGQSEGLNSIIEKIWCCSYKVLKVKICIFKVIFYKLCSFIYVFKDDFEAKLEHLLKKQSATV